MKAVENVEMVGLMAIESEISRDSILAEIHETFKDVSREGGVSWNESKVIDLYGGPDEREEARRADTETHWSQLVDDANWSVLPGVGGFNFLDEIGFRYYLPPAMIRCVQSGCDEGICVYLMERRPEFQSHAKRQQSLLDIRQRSCIARFLLYMARKYDHFYDWNLALNSGWRRYLEPDRC